jgi:hypothetical protein
VVCKLLPSSAWRQPKGLLHAKRAAPGVLPPTVTAAELLEMKNEDPHKHQG